jgi:uncharacterized cofD-like protein
MVNGQKRVVVVGGGTGTYVALTGLKKHTRRLAAIVAVTDSGGSTGRLRDQFGFLPVGDLRQCLAALADANGEAWIRRLLLYRFDRGEGLKGHNLGNLILTALTDLTGSEARAVEVAAKLFRLKGKVLPVSLANVNLVAEYDDGSRVVGEHEIDEPEDPRKRISRLTLEPPAAIYEKAEKVIREADLIVLGPGDLYTSILPNLIVEGVAAAMGKKKGKLVFVLNLMTRAGQTHDFSAARHVEEIKKYLGFYPDVVLVNDEPFPEPIRRRYRRQDEYPVADDLDEKQLPVRVVRRRLLASECYEKARSDAVKRSFLRHDPDKLAQALMDLG